MERRRVAQVELAPDCTNKLEDFHPRELFTLQITKFQFDRKWDAPRRMQIPNSERERERAGLAGADKPISDREGERQGQPYVEFVFCSNFPFAGEMRDHTGNRWI